MKLTKPEVRVLERSVAIGDEDTTLLLGRKGVKELIEKLQRALHLLPCTTASGRSKST
jgi:hypothetical protein